MITEAMEIFFHEQPNEFSITLPVNILGGNDRATMYESIAIPPQITLQGPCPWEFPKTPPCPSNMAGGDGEKDRSNNLTPRQAILGGLSKKSTKRWQLWSSATPQKASAANPCSAVPLAYNLLSDCLQGMCTFGGEDVALFLPINQRANAAPKSGF